MPHYKDGTPANPGDIVRGKGYNVKDSGGNLKEIVAVVMSVNPNVQQCNVTLLIPEQYVGTLTSTALGKSGAMFAGTIEYGQTDHFELVK